MKFLWRFFSRKKMIGLAYHLVSEKPLAHVRRLFRFKNPEQFERDLVYLGKSFQPVSYQQLIRSRREGKSLPPHPVILSFDDGYAECFSVVRPLLLRHKIPAIFFITTDFIDNKRMFFRHQISLCLNKLENMEWKKTRELIKEIKWENIIDPEELRRRLKSLDTRSQEMIDNICRILGVKVEVYLQREKPYLTSTQIRSLAGDGFTIGAHGKSHRRLSLLSPAEREEEIVVSSRRIREITGQEFVPFAFPFDGRGLNPSWLRELQSRHQFINMFFDSQFSDQNPDFVIKRILADSTSGIKRGRSNLPRLISRGCSAVFLIKL